MSDIERDAIVADVFAVLNAEMTAPALDVIEELIDEAISLGRIKGLNEALVLHQVQRRATN